MLKLNCLVHGKTTEHAFTVDIPDGMNVSELKETIKIKKHPNFDKFIADRLELWKVEIPLRSVNDPVLKALRDNPNVDIEDALKGVKLTDPMDDVDEHWQDPPKYHVHIMVKPPLPEKRKYDDILSSITGEGLDSLSKITKERLARIDEFITMRQVALLRSPPQSGKTTLGVLLKRYLMEQGRDAIYLSMIVYRANPSFLKNIDLNSFDAYCKEFTGRTWVECTTSRKQLDIIVDEAQMLYSGADFFWCFVKIQQQEGYRNGNVRMLLLSMYDAQPFSVASGISVTFGEALGLDDLRLTRPEFDELVTTFTTITNISIAIPPSVCNVIFNITMGHPGLVRHSLHLLYDHYRRDFPDTAAMLRYLISPEYFRRIMDTRAFMWLRDLKSQMTAMDFKFLRNALEYIDSCSTFPNHAGTQDIIEKYKRSGLVTQVGHSPSGRLQFAAPLVRVILGQRLYTAPLNLQRAVHDFDEFLILTIQRLRPSVLRISLSHDITTDAALLERQWQNEFYRAATTAVPEKTSISPDVGPVYCSPGYIDYYINGNFNWGFEILREGEDMKEHYERFGVGGTYEKIPFNRWALIDFRRESKEVRVWRDNFWHVLYSEDYSTVTIKRKDKDDLKVVLRGDEVYPVDLLPESVINAIE